jgi:glycosyltransferase involved in cell wall biosynthesis
VVVKPEARPIRVLQLLVSTALGGGSRHVHDLTTRLPAAGFDVTVAAPADGPYADRLRKELVALPMNRLHPRTLGAVVRLVRERGIQVIHSHGKGAGVYGRLAGWWTGIPAVHTVHGIDLTRIPAGVQWLYLGLERRLLPLTRFLIHVSESQAREAERVKLGDPVRSRVIVNGIDVEATQVAAEHGALSKRALGFPDGTLLLGCIARLDTRKGLEILLESVRRLAERYPSIGLVLVGAGRRENELRARAAGDGLLSRVRFTGALVDAHRVLPALDVYVSASRGEGLPLSLLEAMACSLPIVATRVTGHVDVVHDGVTGLLTEPDDPADFARALSLLADQPDLRRTMGRAGRHRVATLFGLDLMVDKTAELYREAVRTTLPRESRQRQHIALRAFLI